MNKTVIKRERTHRIVFLFTQYTYELYVLSSTNWIGTFRHHCEKMSVEYARVCLCTRDLHETE